MSQTTTDRIGITLGDPAGIGPEIVAHALAHVADDLAERLIVFGHRALLERGAQHIGVSLSPDLHVVEGEALAEDEVVAGQPSGMCGAAQVGYLEAAVTAARSGEIAGLVTAPINKTAARAAYFEFHGHTDYLADKLGASRAAMMFAGTRFRVVLVTAHMPLMQVGQVLSPLEITSVTRLALDSIRRDFGIANPRVGVLGLNPHAGEDGMFGSEEATIIGPAIEQIRHQASYAEVSGPLVPDAAFRGDFDLLVAMYHDQALIPIKLVDFDSTVNITLGLPIVRTSPDHGVAYDIAGKGTARPESFRAALELCIDHVDKRRAAAG